MQYQSLTVETIDPAIAVIRLNRPDAANALNTQMAQELAHCLGSQSARAIILTGNGKHFCAGADLKERKGMDEAAWLKQHHAFEAALTALLACDIPVIAAVNGAAMGGGLELALGCDFIYAGEHARFGLTETTLGIMPGLGGTQTLQRAVGSRRAKELLFCGKLFSAEDAVAFGMVNTLCKAESLLDDALACAKTICHNAPLAIKAVKQSVQQGNALPLADALAVELRHYRSLLTSKDRHEGIDAFNEKRKPRFTGE